MIRAFLTDEERRRAKDMYLQDQSNYAQRIAKEIVEPVINRINDTLGQKNVPMYLAYVIEHEIGERYGKTQVEIVEP